MAGVLHGSARTTPRIRAELQASQEATRVLAARYGLNPKTGAKWRKRTTTADQPMGPKRPRSTVLTEAEEAIVVEFRRRTLLPLDDVLGCLRESIPKLTRSALHRCLVRHGISRLPKGDEKTSKRGRFAETRIGYVHIDPCELRLAEGKLPMFLAIDRVSQFTHVAFFDAATKMNGAAFRRAGIAGFPYAIHTVLTDNGMSCPRFLWTPYCPEQLEDDSVEGDGKTMIDAAGLVGSEGERGSSMLSITGQAAGAGPLAPGQRWSLARKHEVVLRLLRGEPVEAVSRQVGVPVWQLERWQARALAGLKTGLRERSEDPAERELAEAHRRIGELSREVELLRARIERPGPLARRRSR